jgi:hypothetical protein
MNRADTLRHLQFAGYHDDRAAFTRLYLENRISLPSANEAFRLGRSALAAGVPCGCSTCRGRVIAAKLSQPQDPTMKLTDYKRWISEISASDLSPSAKAAALELTACQLDDAAWTDGARDGARVLARQARAAMAPGVDLLAGMDELAAAGKLAPVRS